MFSLPSKSAAQEKVRQPDLYYLVVDMSGSISTYGLKQPVIDEVSRFVTGLPDSSVLKIQLFDHRILPEWKREIGPRMTPLAKADIAQWFRRSYDPKGDTFLYDVTAQALQEIAKDREVYDSVRLIILSDGINDTAGRSSKYPDWASLVPLTKGLTQGGKNGDAVWLYLEAVKQDAKKPQPPISAVPHPVDPIKTVVVGPNDAPGYIARAVKPEFQFDAHPTTVTVGQPVAFYPIKDLGTDSYEWSFSDGQKSTEKAPKVTFRTPGSVDVAVTVRGPGGESKAEKKAFVQVLEQAPPPKPSAGFIAHPTNIHPGQEVLFTAYSDIGTASRKWTFGDDSTSTEARPRHAFAKVGTYTVTLEVEGPGGKDSSTSTGLIVVEEVPVDLVVVKISAKPITGRAPLAIRMKNESVGQIARYAWDFGDGNTSDLREPEHTYRVPGVYNVRLTITNTKGESASNSDPVAITVAPPPKPWPWWLRALCFLAAMIMAWLFVIVPLLTKAIGLAGLAVSAKFQQQVGGAGLSLKRLAKSRNFRYWWPKTAVAIGNSTPCDIRVEGLAAASTLVAKIRRVPFSNVLELVPIATDTIHRLEEGPDLATGRPRLNKVAVNSPLRLGKDAIQFDIAGITYEWTVD